MVKRESSHIYRHQTTHHLIYARVTWSAAAATFSASTFFTLSLASLYPGHTSSAKKIWEPPKIHGLIFSFPAPWTKKKRLVVPQFCIMRFANAPAFCSGDELANASPQAALFALS